MDRIWYRLPLMMTSALCLSLSPVYGAEGSSVKVRGSDHNGYTRFVFEAAGKPKYQAASDDKHIVLTFPDNTSFNGEETALGGLSRVTGYKVLPNHSVEIDFGKGITVRHFVAGNRIIVDLKGEAPKSEKSEKPEKSETPAKQEKTAKQPPEKNDPEKAEKKESTSPEPVGKEDESIARLRAKIEAQLKPLKESQDRVIVDDSSPDSSPPEAEKEAAPADEKPATATEKKEPEAATATEEATKHPAYSATVAGTSAFAMASFVKGGQLWVVIDKPDVVIPPRFEGTGTAHPDPFRKVDMPSAPDVTVFKAPVPAGYKITSGGGGLVWTLDLTEKGEENAPSKPMARAPDKLAGEGGAALLWPATSFHRARDIIDPESGEKITVGMVELAQDHAISPQIFAELNTLPSPVGMAFMPKVDDISVTVKPEGMLVTRPDGLTLSQPVDMVSYTGEAEKTEEEKPDASAVSASGAGHLFDFAAWKNGDDFASMIDNQRLVLSGLPRQTDLKKSEGLIGLGRMMLARGYAPESRGYFQLAQGYMPELDKNAEFQSLYALANALSGDDKEAFAGLSNPVLDDIDEVRVWKSYTLAGLNDWAQAAKVAPTSLDFIKDYPDAILFPLGLRLAEVALRDGTTSKAGQILDILESRKTKATPLGYTAALTYLQGELARQKGDRAKAKELWSSLEKGKDDLYRVKAKLALTSLRYADKEITIDKAIDTLEGLRYAWRGDELETAVNFNLGKMYLEKGEPVRALGLMRQASAQMPNSEQGKTISNVMHATFQDLYLTDKVQKLSPLEALAMYDEFADLVPPGAEGDRLARQLAERLADVDLVPRAIALLKKQVDTRLSGEEGAGVALRLASLQVMDNKPKDAMESLDRADAYLADVPPEKADPKRRQIALLRAKSFAQAGQPEKAFDSLELLSQDEDVLKLRADIAWRAKRWQDAADSLAELVGKENLSPTRPLADAQAQLVMDWAVALYLADNRYVLANLRERYSDMMSQTGKAKEFEVVTRPRQNILLADRDTIEGIIGETDIFKDFVESLKGDLTGPVTEAEKAAAGGDKKATPQPAAPQAAAAKQAAPADEKPAAPAAPGTVPEIKTDDVLAD